MQPCFVKWVFSTAEVGEYRVKESEIISRSLRALDPVVNSLLYSTHDFSVIYVREVGWTFYKLDFHLIESVLYGFYVYFAGRSSHKPGVASWDIVEFMILCRFPGPLKEDQPQNIMHLAVGGLDFCLFHHYTLQ